MEDEKIYDIKCVEKFINNKPVICGWFVGKEKAEKAVSVFKEISPHFDYWIVEH